MEQAVGARSKSRLPPTAVLGWQALARDKTWPGCSYTCFCIMQNASKCWFSCKFWLRISVPNTIKHPCPLLDSHASDLSCVRVYRRTYRNIDSTSRLWPHSAELRLATGAASWCRSPTAGQASSPSPAWSHCHSQSSSLKSPPKNGPRRMGLHSGHDACSNKRGKCCKIQMCKYKNRSSR